MSGAQSKAAMITGAVGVIAEVDPDAVQQRLDDGYIQKENVYTDLVELRKQIIMHKLNGSAIALIYHGNIVDLLEYFVKESIVVEMGSDQTSLHNIDDLGYCPAGYSFEEAKELLRSDKKKFLSEVSNSLERHVAAVNALCDNGMYFWDYGNAFLLEAGKTNADIWKDKERGLYKYPSYVEDIMGPMCFDFGFGPFRWVCTSGLKEDLDAEDEIFFGTFHFRSVY